MTTTMAQLSHDTCTLVDNSGHYFLTLKLYFARDFRFPMVADFLFRDKAVGTYTLSLTSEDPSFLLLLLEVSSSSIACLFFRRTAFSLFLTHSLPRVGSLAGEFWSLSKLVFVCLAT